ncbi:MAG: AzlD family protein [Pelagimonas sp.]|uniref:AzlD family protein n=1 Tax=Pelagimonas sp. TaxID=2073170 RepID=UPI003D6A9AF1
MHDTILIIILCASATYATRFGGHLIMLRFGQVNHRVEAALGAVPIAILTALVAPSLLTGGIPGVVALVATGLAAWRMSLVTSVALGLAVLLILRAAGL